MAIAPRTAHCNRCLGDRLHYVLHEEKVDWYVEEAGISGDERYETLKCCGCESVVLRQTSSCSEDIGEATVVQYPAPTHRVVPRWTSELPEDKNGNFIRAMLKQVYRAHQEGLNSLAVMGIRSILERVMSAKCGETGTFKVKLAKLQQKGFVGSVQARPFATHLDAGHAATHRGWDPQPFVIAELLDTLEALIHSIYIQKESAKTLKSIVPKKRAKRK